MTLSETLPVRTFNERFDSVVLDVQSITGFSGISTCSSMRYYLREVQREMLAQNQATSLL